MSITELKAMARTVRSDIVTMIHQAGSGHPGGSLSATDLMVGLGSTVAECLAKHCPVPVEMVAVEDTFGESGQPQELMDKYGLNQAAIEAKIKAVLARK